MTSWEWSRSAQALWLRSLANKRAKRKKGLIGNPLLRVKSVDPESQRKEFVLVTMLVGIIAAAAVAIVVTLFNSLTLSDYQGAPPFAVAACLALFVFIYWLRHKHLAAASYIFVAILLLCGLIPLALWGIALPQGLLICALAITVAGILLSARWALLLTISTTGVMILLSSLHADGVLAPRTEWHNINPTTTDAIVFAITFGVIAMVSWLSHHQTMSSLHRARIGERSLIIERNSLERKVKERTHDLERSQLGQMIQLQRFAEFGRVSSGLVHDIMNPLAAASLNLDQLRNSEQAHQVRQSLLHIERYVDAMGRQLRASSSMRRFDVAEEIEMVMQILEYRRRQKRVDVDVEVGNGMELDGDPVTFSQVVANLVANAIDAYDEASSEVPYRVVVRVTKAPGGKKLVMTVQDWGVGISPSKIDKIFEPFYSTKANSRGIGIGLSVAKTTIERDFGGSLLVLSSPKLGTRFVVEIPLRLGANSARS